jgi:uncharacterized protein (TIGR03790 family)
VRRRLAFLLLGTLVALARAAAEDAAQRTVIVANSRVPDSLALAKFYAEQRSIPAGNIIALPMPEEETITWRQFVDSVWHPLQDELLRRKWLEGYAAQKVDAHGRRTTSVSGHRMAFLVTCLGVPLRIHHDPTTVDARVARRMRSIFRTNHGAVDSELSLLAQGSYESLGYQPNPLFEARRGAELRAQQVVKVARLDGPSLRDAQNLVTSALAAERDGLAGRYYIDRSGPHREGDEWLAEARKILVRLGFEGESHDDAGTFPPEQALESAAFYFGWYNDTVNGPFLAPGFRFNAGAIALHIHSGSAGTLRSPAERWAGPLIARGAAATFGNVFEPYLQLTIRPNLLMEKLSEGAMLGDAVYFATPTLSWQTVAIGDPLYRPFGNQRTKKAPPAERLREGGGG